MTINLELTGRYLSHPGISAPVMHVLSSQWTVFYSHIYLHLDLMNPELEPFSGRTSLKFSKNEDTTSWIISVPEMASGVGYPMDRTKCRLVHTTAEVMTSRG